MSLLGGRNSLLRAWVHPTSLVNAEKRALGHPTQNLVI